MGAYRFSMAPNISVPRSKFKMPFNHVTTFDHGKLVPIDCFEILPGDEFKCDFSSIIRMSTPIAPIFGNIKAHVHAFFVPMRLIWEHTKEFYGENRTSSGYQTTTYQIPSVGTGILNSQVVNSLSCYFGHNSAVNTGNNGYNEFSILKYRGYGLIWNEYYRAQQIQNPILLVLDDTGGIGTFTNGNNNYTSGTSTTFDPNIHPFNVCKEFDYFTACTTAPQYGASVTLPLGTTAPVLGLSTKSNGQTANQGITLDNDTPIWTGPNSTFNIGVYDSTGNIPFGSMIADLQNATAASINTIRYAFQAQKWLERANFGSRFFEMLNLHYGVTSPDARLQRPEYLGGFDFYINVDQVLSTAGYVASTSTTVGQPGAVSVTGVKNRNLFHKAFVEPGYVYVLISTTHERCYGQGIPREDLRQDRFDFYFPEFANLGDQAISNLEIYNNDPNTAPGIFGYQEHWAEYRYRANRVSGLMNPKNASALDYWNLADEYSSLPSLSNSWIMEDGDELHRCLVTGASGPDYIGDFFLNYTAIREMPLYTIPGLVDHFGTM